MSIEGLIGSIIDLAGPGLEELEQLCDSGMSFSLQNRYDFYKKIEKKIPHKFVYRSSRTLPALLVGVAPELFLELSEMEYDFKDYSELIRAIDVILDTLTSGSSGAQVKKSKICSVIKDVFGTKSNELIEARAVFSRKGKEEMKSKKKKQSGDIFNEVKSAVESLEEKGLPASNARLVGIGIPLNHVIFYKKEAERRELLEEKRAKKEAKELEKRLLKAKEEEEREENDEEEDEEQEKNADLSASQDEEHQDGEQ